VTGPADRTGGPDPGAATVSGGMTGGRTPGGMTGGRASGGSARGRTRGGSGTVQGAMWVRYG
jgi:hypothetical protein